MVARRIYVPEAQPSRDPNGRALPARLAFFVPGSARDTHSTIYADNSLTTTLANPVESDSAGHFPPMWADSATTFDVVWSDLAVDRQLGAWEAVSTLTDAAVASLTLTEAAAVSAQASATAAAASAAAAQAIGDAFGDVDAAVAAAQTARVAAEAAQVAAQLAATNAQTWNPANYSTAAQVTAQVTAGDAAGLIAAKAFAMCCAAAL